ncbi:MAG: hypothetical protein ACHQUB_01795 [Candidatus Saccharimonadia bacterium]
MRKLLYFLPIALGLGILAALPAHAEVPALKIDPLKYEQGFSDNNPKLGFVDVSNPTDSMVTVASSIKAFRQYNLDGDLQFYDDPTLTKGIQISLGTFELGPREAIRVAFTVDPQVLPKGGIYAVLFFETVPDNATAQGTVISESARVGTLLLLNNGPSTTKTGSISNLSVPVWQFGNALNGKFEYSNTASSSSGGVAYDPNINLRVLPLGAATQLQFGLVMPGSSRVFSFSKSGSYLGIIPLQFQDLYTHKTKVIWIFAITGYFREVLYGIGFLILLRLFFWTRLKSKS